MATLERIRRRSGLLIVVIGLAMLGFILTDLLGSGDSLFRGDANVVGKIDRRSVDLQEFSQLMDQREQMIRQQNPEQARFITRKQIADGVWDELLREELMNKQYEELGFEITSRELFERVKSNPTIQQAPAFRDEVSGQFSESQFLQYISQLQDNKDFDPEAAEAYEQWVGFESSIKKEALQTKYSQALQKGIYMPSAIAREKYQRNNTQAGANFIVQEYTSIPDSEISVEESDFKAYYQKNKEEFKSEKLADIQYVNFPISASESDLQEIREELRGYMEPEVVTRNGRTDTLPSFATAEEDSLFAASRSDLRVTAEYYKQDELPAGLDSSIFEEPVGSVVGPYRAEDYYRLSKVADKKALPDSVKARHILISFRELENGNPDRGFEEARALADSLTDVLQEDTSRFAEIARNLSDDPGSAAQGGEMEWFDEETMVRPFSNFAFRNEVGDLRMVSSQFGFHIIEILDQGGSTEAVKLLNISREIMASDETLDRVYSQASSFAASVNNMEEFSARAEEEGYQPRPVTDLKPFDENIIGVGNNREIVRWAHGEDTEVGDIQLFSNGNESYVVVILTDAAEEGYRPLEAVKERIRPEVVKHLKANQLKEKFASAAEAKQDIKAVADELGLTVNSQQVSFSTSNLQGYGQEPKVTGAITALEPNVLSNPIEGNRGVYMVQVQNRTPAQDLPTYANAQTEEAQAKRARAREQVLNSLKEQARIEDRRAKFY